MSFPVVTQTLNERLDKIRTYLRLGLVNVGTVILYRIALRLGYCKKHMVSPPDNDEWVDVPFHCSGFCEPEQPIDSAVVDVADALLKGKFSIFSRYLMDFGNSPDWFVNPFNLKKYPFVTKHWSELNDFEADVGDIKCIWEISRFDWLLVLVRAYRQTGRKEYLDTANSWFVDWNKKNPLYIGPNWKCGQEAGIRMMQVLLAAFLLGQENAPSRSLIRFVQQHAARIRPTLRYAIAQDNNHGTSEAAALFWAGSWLLSVDTDTVNADQGKRWRNLGRKWLENRMQRLVADDGSFSQYSVNYHRVVLDTICYTEFWRSLLQEPSFSDSLYAKARALAKWLYVMTDECSGDTPNIGANDGARVFNLAFLDYRDCRPSVQLASRLFMGKPAYPPGAYDEALAWLGIPFAEEDYSALPMDKKSCLFEDGGYCFLQQENTRVFVRFPVFRFRPGHADALHLDLWHKGLNVIRDAGTYSYNTEERWLQYFAGTQAHSTVEFDGRDQMKRLSRFLFGNWLQVNHLTSIKNIAQGVTWSAGYKDHAGAEHRREIHLFSGKILINDQVSGFQEQAIIRWRLCPDQWNLQNCTCSSGKATLRVSTTAKHMHLALTTGYESRYYLEKSALPVLSIAIREPGKVTTEINLQ